jgi:hypothetical protein
MFYKDTAQELIAEGHWNERTAIVAEGGYSLDKSNLPADYKVLPKGAVVAVSKDSAKLIKTAKLYEAAEQGATEIKVAKNHALKVGDTLAGSEISKIEVGELYDTITIAALSEAAELGEVIAEDFEGEARLNYASIPVIGEPAISTTIQAYEIVEDSLPYAINDAIKASLTSRHAFKI